MEWQSGGCMQGLGARKKPVLPWASLPISLGSVQKSPLSHFQHALNLFSLWSFLLTPELEIAEFYFNYLLFKIGGERGLGIHYCTVLVFALASPTLPQLLCWPHPSYPDLYQCFQNCAEEVELHFAVEETVGLEIRWLVLTPTVRKYQTQTEIQLSDFQPSVPVLK